MVCELVDIITVLSILVPVLSSILYLAYWLGVKFASIDEKFKLIDERFKWIDKRFESVDERFKRLESEIAGLRDVFTQYNEILLSLLEAKGVLSKSEMLALRGVLGSLRPHSVSKYYTKEVAKRLDELLAKDPDELTLSDLEDLDNIADLIWREGYESGRKDLREYGMKLKLYVMMVKVVCIYPKLRKLQEGIIKPSS